MGNINFPSIIVDESDLQSLDDEWRKLQFPDQTNLSQSSSTVTEMAGQDVVSFWGQVNTICAIHQAIKDLQ